MDNELKGFLHVPILGVTLAGIFLIGGDILFPLGPFMITMAVLSMGVLHYWPPKEIPPRTPGFGDGDYNDE